MAERAVTPKTGDIKAGQRHGHGTIGAETAAATDAV
jgi:hypothetical protein